MERATGELMRLATNVFDVWAFQRHSRQVKYLLLYTAQMKADKHFNGGRFWQIPSGFSDDEEHIEDAIHRVLGTYGLTPRAIWAGEHAYLIYNHRFREMQAIGVYAAEVRDDPVRLSPDEHSNHGWLLVSNVQAFV